MRSCMEALIQRLTYYGGGQGVWPLRRLSCGNAKLASPHLIAPVISPHYWVLLVERLGSRQL
jgi:hypothetical protein